MAQPAMDITPLLLAAQDADAGTRTQAEAQISLFREQNYPGFLGCLINELANSGKPADSRRLAGIILKNTLDAKEEARKQELQARWNTLDAALQNHIKEGLLATLRTPEAEVRHTAALVLAKVAAIELPKRTWPQLINTLLGYMSAEPTDHGLRQATLESLGYICEEMALLKDDVLEAQEVNMILTAVVSGMRPEEPSPETRLAATQALCNAIEFADHNFDNEQERNYIMQVVCQGSIDSDVRIKTASFVCLHEIAASYYSKLPPYMQDIFAITVKAVREDDEGVGLQAVEFWSTVCDYEIELEEVPEADEVNHGFIKAVAPHLVPVLLEQLTKQEEGDEQDDTTWNLAMAAGTCLGLMAKLAGDDIVKLVMPYVQLNINKNTVPEDWRFREAATIAFGSILEGPSPAALTEIVKQALGFLLQAMSDAEPHVRDTTAWTIGRIFEFLHDSQIDPPLINKDTLPPVVSVLEAGLRDQPQIAYRVCDAIGHLAEGFKDYSTSGPTSPLSPFFKRLVSALLAASSTHAGADNAKVQIAAFEAINELVRAASQDTLDVVGQLIPVFLGEIKGTFEMVITTAEARERQAELQGQLCGVLTVIIQKLSENDGTKAAVLQSADQIMETLLRIFSNRSATVHEEAMLAVGAFTYACGHQFTKYMQAFHTYLEMGLSNHQEWQVCLSTVGVLGDVCRTIEADILPYCPAIMNLLVANLSSNDVHRNIKPHILSAFGDIALVIGDQFVQYADVVRRMLQQAMHLSVVSSNNKGDDDFMDYNTDLRNGILEAYTGMFQGMGATKAEQQLGADAPIIVQFINAIANEASYDDLVAKGCVNLLGDMLSTVPSAVAALRQPDGQAWEKLVQFCSQSEHVQDETQWAVELIQRATSS